ncbi:MAG: SPOR domain-containing protein [Candidatus Sumerlaeota bacterium]|nr:SPOR domain-containing protein [Candidatus Sumerlaeota bacterium]
MELIKLTKTSYLLLALLAVTLAHGQERLFFDDFSGANGQRPTRWKISEGVPPTYFAIKDGELATGNGDDLSIASGYTFATVSVKDSSEWMDYSVNVDFWAKQFNGRILTVGRYQDAFNHYEGYLDVSRTLEGRQRKAGIAVVEKGERRVLGEVTDGQRGIAIATIEGMKSPAERRNVSLVFFKENIALVVDGKPLVSVRDRTFQRGTAGIGQRYDEVFFDNFKVIPVDEKTGAPKVEILAPSVKAAAAPFAIGPAAEAPTLYWVNMGENLKEPDAVKIKSSLEAKGVKNAQISTNQGAKRVLVGAFFSEAEAKSNQQMLETEGFKPVGIVSSKVDLSAQAEAGLFEYRIVSKAYTDEARARILRDALSSDGFGSAQLLAEGNAFGVVVGPFPSNSSALAALAKMKTGGYVGMTVTQRELTSIASEMQTMTSGDINKIIVNLLAQMKEQDRIEAEKTFRSIFATMQKDVNDRTQGDLDNIRNRLAELEGQKDLLKQLSTAITEEKQRKEKISQLIDKVSEAADGKKWADARTALGALKAFDPQNAQVPIKENAIRAGEMGIGELLEVVPRNYSEIRERIKKLDMRSVSDVALARDIARKVREDSRTQKSYAAQALLQYRSILMTANQLLDADKDKDPKEQMDKDFKTKLDEAKVEAEAQVKELAVVVKAFEDETIDIKNKVVQSKETQKMMMYVIAAVFGILMVFILFLTFAIIMQRKRHKEILALVQEIPMRPVLPLGEEKKQLTSRTGPKALAAAAREGEEEPTMREASVAEESPSYESAEEQMVVTAGSDRESVSPESSYYEQPTLIEPSHEETRSRANADLSSGFGDIPVFGAEEEEKQEEMGLPPAPPAEAPRSYGHEDDVISLADLDMGPEKPVAAEEPPTAGWGESAESQPVASGEMTIPMEMPAEIPAFEEAPSHEAAPPAQPPAGLADMELNLDDLSPMSEPVSMGTAPGSAAPSPAPSRRASSVELGDEALDLSDILGSSAIPETTAETLGPIPASEAAPGEAMASPFEIAEEPMAPVDESMDVIFGAAKSTVETPAVSAPAAGAAGDILYAEALDGQSVSQRPAGWEGEYAYAKLSVESATPSEGSRSYIRFEKANGAGSAHCFKKFPDVSGEFSIEFDICCHEKNKYLLGFYLEKDKDFRQSIHTIIHRTDPQAPSALRVQGESTPYRFGDWARVRYDVDLGQGVVSGFVNGKKVADRVALANCPPSINTLSIRDNLATTGVLMIGGIKVTKLA